MSDESSATVATGSELPDIERLLADGDAALARRRLGEALTAFRKAVRLAPDDWRGYERLAGVLRRIGNLDEAVKVAKRGGNLAPEEPSMRAEVELSRRLASKAHPISPLKRARADFQTNLGNSYLVAHRQSKKAAEAFKRALDLDPENSQRMIRLANVLSQIGRPEEAAALLGRARECAPDSAAVWTALAELRQATGNSEDAKTAWRRAIELAPDGAFSLSVLIKQFPDEADDNMVFRAEKLANDNDSRSRSRQQLHFALSALGQHRDDLVYAFDHLSEANRLRRDELNANNLGYRQSSHEDYVTRIIRTFDADFFERTKGMGNPTQRPIFVLGMPRSGTTLCEQILASHSQVYGAGEFEGIPSIMRQIPGALARPGETLGSFPCAMDRLAPEVVKRFGDHYLEETGQLSRAARITDKLPGNFLHVGLIHLLFPNAKIVHCVRDPMDNAFSCFEQNFKQLTSWSWDLEDIGHFYGQYRRLMEHWERVLPIPMLRFSYEETVGALKASAKRLLAFCELEFEPACLDFHKTERLVLTASNSQVRRPIYSSSIGKWKRFERQLEALRQVITNATASR